MTEPQPEFARVALTDYVPAGFEIDNPRLVSSGDAGTLDWIANAGTPVHTEFRDDRFTAAFERRKGDPATYSVAYIVRAVSPGELRAAAGGGRGHVPARPLRPDRDRRGRGRSGKMSDRVEQRHAGGAVALLAAIGAIWVVAAVAGAIAGLVEAYGPPPLGRDLEVSRVVLDRNGAAAQGLSHQRRTLAASRDARAMSIRVTSKCCSPMRTSASSQHRGVDPLAHCARRASSS